MKPIYLYGISGARDQYRVVRYEEINPEHFSIGYAKHAAAMMRIRYPSVEHVYAMDQRYGLRNDFMEAFKKNSVESWAIFKDILETEGLRIF